MSDPKDYSRGFGGGALGARLRRASERIDRDSTRVYAALDIRFEQRWYGVLRQLVKGWLSRSKDVLAFCHPPPNDGGEGALWILLRSPGRH